VSNRSFIEINHDYAGEISRAPAGTIERLLLAYLRAGSRDDADALSRYGISVLYMRHHSDAATLNINGRIAWTENTGPREVGEEMGR